MVNPLGEARRYAYDVRGRLVRYTNGRGGRVVYQYDAGDRLVQKALYRADGTLEDTVVYGYDGLGRLVRADLPGYGVTRMCVRETS